MPPTATSYPVRLFIRHKAQRKIATALATSGAKVAIDAQLFQDVVATVLQPQVNTALYQSYESRALAEQVEDQAVEAIAGAYLRLWQRQRDAEVQRLNQLLEHS